MTFTLRNVKKFKIGCSGEPAYANLLVKVTSKIFSFFSAFYEFY